MTRSIVLRFPATCFDCGRSLSAGTTARWFGKGRVSCCGGSTAPAAGASPVATAPDLLPSSTFKPTAQACDNTLAGAERRFLPPAVADAVLTGLQPAQLPELAAAAPNLLLLVRLTSGARLIVPAVHASHVIACLTESCMDRVRDVTRATVQEGGAA